MSNESTHSHKVLIIDDDEGVRSSLRLLLKSQFEVETADNGASGVALIGSFHPDVVLLDVMMPELDGLDTLKRIRENGAMLPVIMLTAALEVRTAVSAMKLGAVDYLNKPFDIDELTGVLRKVLVDQPPLLNSSKVPLQRASPLDGKPKESLPLVGNSEEMRKLRELISQIAEKDASVLITGESGTGKELVARNIHMHSLRKKSPFVAINCAAIPETLLETELFGHEKGAFTSAQDERIGLCEQAHGGTLFLDEIGELPLSVQVKLLRFLQEREFFRVGSSTPRRVDVRVIAATNRDLEKDVAAGKFRSDLFYRIHVIHVPIPALRDRFHDIPVLLQYFTDQLSERYNGKSITFTPDAEAALVRYDWPGNVRELENLIESLLALSLVEEIGIDALPSRFLLRSAKEMQRLSAHTQTSLHKIDFSETEKAFESDMIAKALRRTNGNEEKAAEILGISPRILRYKLEKFGIDRHD